MKVYAITLKGMTRDANGLPNYIWATASQVFKIVQMRNDPDKRLRFIKIGGHIFAPADILHIEEKNTEHYGLPIPAYVRKRYLEDMQKANNGWQIVENI